MDHQHSRPDPQTRITGDEQWRGWWVFPLALLLVTAVLIVASVVIQGTGQDSGSAAAGQTAATPATQAPKR